GSAPANREVWRPPVAGSWEAGVWTNFRRANANWCRRSSSGSGRFRDVHAAEVIGCRTRSSGRDRGGEAASPAPHDSATMPDSGPAAIEADMDPTFFETPADFRAWLAENHAEAGFLWVGFYKKGSGRRSITC